MCVWCGGVVVVGEGYAVWGWEAVQHTLFVCTTVTVSHVCVWGGVGEKHTDCSLAHTGAKAL